MNETIKLANKEIARYEIYIEAWDHNKSMRYPIKNKTFIDDEFTAAVNMCKEENNNNILVHLCRC